ncbi:MAG: hypothetical protein AAF206_09595 [Bacteroidota bacterium]
MRITTSLFFFCILLMSVQAQDALTERMMAEADKMGHALIVGDYDSFIPYTFPKIIDMIGGEESMRNMLETTRATMQGNGVDFSKVDFTEPSALIEKEGSIQATVRQKLIMKTPQGNLMARSGLIALSLDEGKSWYFIDTNGKSLAELQAIIPSLSDDLEIPPTEKPVMLRN